MNPDLRVKLIKKKKNRVPRIPPLVQSSAVENKWSSAIQSWVSEFQKRRVESLRGFNCLSSALIKTEIDEWKPITYVVLKWLRS
jgi:hypothetical protein